MHFLIFAAASLPQVALPTIFGQQLGDPPALPNCTSDDFSSSSTARVCWQRDPVLAKIDPASGTIMFPSSMTPEIVWTTVGTNGVRDGSARVENITFLTRSHNHSAEIVRALNAKFGQPTTVGRLRVIVAGVPFSSPHYVWKRPGYIVDYNAIEDLDNGQVSISTTKYARWEVDSEKADDAKRVKF